MVPSPLNAEGSYKGGVYDALKELIRPRGRSSLIDACTKTVSRNNHKPNVLGGIIMSRHLFYLWRPFMAKSRFVPIYAPDSLAITGNYTQCTAKVDPPSDEDIHDLSDPEAFGLALVNHLIS
jgi:hypothetical protein